MSVFFVWQFDHQSVRSIRLESDSLASMSSSIQQQPCLHSLREEQSFQQPFLLYLNSIRCYAQATLALGILGEQGSAHRFNQVVGHRVLGKVQPMGFQNPLIFTQAL